MQGKPPQSKPPPKFTRRVSPAEWAWLDRINRQLAYDEYMQAKREYWLAARPARGNPTGLEPAPTVLPRRRRRGRYCLNKQRIVGPQFSLTGACRPYDPAFRRTF